jgi:hypothetical protein
MDDQTRQRWHFIAELCRRAGPYALIELLLPGGTLIALALFVYRRSRRDGVPFGTAVRDELTRTTLAVRHWLPPRSAAPAPLAHTNHDGLEPLAMAPGC